MADVEWTSEALVHLTEIANYIEQFDPAAAARMERRLRDLGDSLRDFPHRGRPAAGGVRELPSVPPYVLRYRVAEETVVILSIRHSRRRPLA